MDMLWEKFQWILPLYKKPITFQSKASVVCSVTAAVFIDFLPDETKSKASVVCSVTAAVFIDFLPDETKCVFPTYL